MSLYILWAHICCSIVKKFSNILVVMVPTVLSWEIALAWPFWIVWYIFQILLCAKNQNVHQLRRAYLFWCTTCSTFFLIKYLPCLCLCTYIQCLTYLHCKMLLLSCSSLMSQRVYLCVSWIRCIFIFFCFCFCFVFLFLGLITLLYPLVAFHACTFFLFFCNNISGQFLSICFCWLVQVCLYLLKITVAPRRVLSSWSCALSSHSDLTDWLHLGVSAFSELLLWPDICWGHK